MTPYETSATIAEHGALHLGGLPFPPGTQVEASIRAKEASPSSKQVAYDELDEVYTACHTPHWDAHGAEPVQWDTVENAHRLLEALPPGYPLPTVGAEPDGHATLDGIAGRNGSWR